MHELSICQSMLNQVSNIVHEHGADSVSRITLRVGPLSGIEPQLLLQAFPLASAGTVAEHAKLHKFTPGHAIQVFHLCRWV